MSDYIFNGTKSAVISRDTTAVTGDFYAITVLNDCVFTSLTRADTTGNINGLNLPAGMTIYGKITAFTLQSGAVIAYKL